MKPVVFLASVALAFAASSTIAQPEIKSASYKITKVHRYDAQVVRIAGQGLTVDIEGFGRRRFQVPHDFTFEIDDEQKSLRQLSPGQRLRVYVTRVETGELLLMQDEAATDGVVGEKIGCEKVGGDDSGEEPES